VTESIRTVSTSRRTADVEPVVLRETNTTRLLFRPTLVENPHDQAAAVRGHFVHQRKKPSGDWEDYSEFPLSSLRDSEWVKLELHSGELLKLFGELDSLYALVEAHGVPAGEREFVQVGANTRRLLSDPELTGRLLSDSELDLVAAFVRWLASNPSEAIQRLTDDLTELDLAAFDSLLSAARLRQFYAAFRGNASNGDESFWQEFFKTNSWVLARLYSHPYVLVQDQAYVGGKTIDNRGGSLADFLYENRLTGNVLIVEIKSPTTTLLGSQYRNRVFPPSVEVVGAITQALTNRRTLIEEYGSTRPEGDSWSPSSPRCLVVAGSARLERMSANQRTSFELFRNQLRDLDLVTFDELAEQVQRLLAITSESA
jgi:hypothetical protein